MWSCSDPRAAVHRIPGPSLPTTARSQRIGHGVNPGAPGVRATASPATAPVASPSAPGSC